MRLVCPALPWRLRSVVRRCRGAALALALGLVAMLPPGGGAAAEPDRTVIEVVGDSQAQGLAGALQRRYLRSDRVRVLDRSKIATGIAVHANFDWPSAARALAADHHVDIVVIMFGANDRPPIRRNGQVDPNLREEYRHTYEERVREIIRAFRNAGIEVIWVGHPVVRDNVYTEDMAFLNQIFREGSVEEGAHWVPTWDMFTTPDGGYTAFGKGIDGLTQRLRADDGVHFTAAGYDLVAARIEPLIEARRALLAQSPSAAR